MEPAGRGRVERRLAAILAADVAGYSRLMGADEEGALERLKALRRELLDPKIAEDHGQMVESTGDGTYGSTVCCRAVVGIRSECAIGPVAKKNRAIGIRLLVSG
jgi:class 3 adenylate cyclase